MAYDESFWDTAEEPISAPSGLKPMEDRKKEDEDFGFFDYAKDIAAAVPRGLAGAVEGIGELGNIIPGVDYDIARNLGLGRSETFVGGAIEGITEFATAFVPVVGWVGKGAKVAGMAGKAGKGVKLAGGLQKAAKLKGVKGWAARRGQEAIAGGIADFMVMPGHEARLSDLIQQFPSLKNPVTEFLQSDEDDPEIVGRLKAAVEGIGAGMVFDSFLLGLKGMRKGRGAFDDAVKKGATEEQGIRSQVEALETVQREADEAATKTADKEGLWDTDIDFDSPAHEGEILVYVDPRKLADDHVRTDPQFKDAGDIPPTGGIQKRVDEGKPIYPAEFFHEDTPAGFRNGRHRILWAADQGLDSVPLITSKDSLPNLQKYLTDGPTPKTLDDATGTGGKPPEPTEIDLVNATRKDLEATGVIDVQTGRLNMRNVEGETKHIIRAIEEIRADEIAARGETLPDKEVVANNVLSYADMVGESEKVARQGMERDGLTVSQINNRTLAYREILTSLVNDRLKPALDAVHLARKDRKRLPDELKDYSEDELVFKAVSEMETVLDHIVSMRNLRAAQSQGLRVMKYSERFAQALGDDQIGDALLKGREALLAEMGGRKRLIERMDVLAKVLDDDGIEAALRSLRKQKGNPYLMAFNEMFINNILSGPKTLVTNFIGPMVVSAYRPLENFTGGLILRDTKVMKKALREFTGLALSWSDSLSVARKSWKEDELIADPMARQVDLPSSQRKAISARAFDVDEKSGAGGMLDTFGKFFGMPTRFLGATDEFVKQLNYRTVVRADLMEQADELIKAGKLLPIDAGRFVRDEMDKMVVNGAALTAQSLEAEAKRLGKRVGSERESWIAEQLKTPDGIRNRGKLAQRAIDIAREVTFTRPLKGTESAFRKMSRRGQMLVNAHPILRPMIPFIRTPANLLSYAGERVTDPAMALLRIYRPIKRTTPKDFVALHDNASRMLADLASGNPQLRAEAYGRAMTGLGFTAAGIGFAMSGNLTGGGPKDHKQKKILQEAGWQPYSIKVGDDYLSYQRADPFASILGLFADITDISRYAPPEMEEDVSNLGMNFAISISRNIGSKTYLQGVMDIASLLEDPERAVGNTLQKFGGSLVPMSGLLGQGVQALGGDESMREIRSMVDAAQAKVPFLSSSEVLGHRVDAQRNFMGEPSERYMSLGGRWTDWWLPVMHSTTSSDPINRELAGLGHAFSPPSSNRYNIDMRSIKGTSGQSAYDRWMELHQEVRIGGRSLNQAMNRLIRSSGYRRLSPEGFGDEGSPRVIEITKLVRKYRSKAESQLWREFPEVHAARKNKMVIRRAQRTGQTTESIRASLFPLD